MTCKDCIHYNVCNDKNSSYVSCSNFKDKSKIIKLPCKIGSKVWVIDSYDGYSGYVFLGCNENYAFLGSGINGSFDVDDICQYGFEEFQDYSPSAYIVPLKKVFLTKESAEQALRERETK